MATKNINRNMMIYNSLSFEEDGITFDIPLKSSRVVIQGDSGQGKTLLFSLLRFAKLNQTMNPQLISLIDDIRCFKYEDTSSRKHLLDALQTEKHRLFIIDNADILLTEREDLSLIRNTENQLVIIGRCAGFYGVPPKHTAELRMDATHSRVYLNYLGWPDYEIFDN